MEGTAPRISGSILWVGVVGVIVLLAILPLMGLPRAWFLYIFLFFIYLALANMWNLLCGYCGLISLCQPAFIGLGGYTLVIFTWNGLPVYLGIIGGAIVAAIFAVLISIPVFRLKGIYFAIGTLVPWLLFWFLLVFASYPGPFDELSVEGRLTLVLTWGFCFLSGYLSLRTLRWIARQNPVPKVEQPPVEAPPLPKTR